MIEELELQDQISISATPLIALDAYIAFQPTEEGIVLAQKFSDALKKMKQDGTLAKILSKVPK